MLGKLACGVGMHMVIDGLLDYVHTFFAQHPCYLAGRPVVLYYHLVYAPPQLLWFAVVAFKPMLATFTLLLGVAPYIRSIGIAVASYFAQYRRWMNFYRSCNFSFWNFPFNSEVNCVPLL